MNYLLDTNHWSHIQRGNPAVLAKLQSLSDDTVLFMPVVAQAELLAGVETMAEGRRKQELRHLYEDVLQEATEILPIASRVAERFAAVFAQLRRAGTPIKTNDMWVGTIALAHHPTVVSSDAHFRCIQGVRVEDWATPAQPGS